VKRIKKSFQGDLKGKKIMVIGAGKIGSSIVSELIKKDDVEILVTSRTHGRVQELFGNAENVRVVPYSERYQYICECDVTISSTTSPHHTVAADMLRRAHAGGKPILIIDLAVPRDVEEDVKSIPGITLYNIDDFKSSCSEANFYPVNVEKINRIIEDRIREFKKWYAERCMLPLIKEIQGYTEQVVRVRIERASKRLKDLSGSQMEQVERTVRSAVEDILQKVVYGIRDTEDENKLSTYLEVLSGAFTKSTSR